VYTAFIVRFRSRKNAALEEAKAAQLKANANTANANTARR